jgi:hypothetical protein
MGFYPVAMVLPQDNTLMHISNNITSLKKQTSTQSYRNIEYNIKKDK